MSFWTWGLTSQETMEQLAKQAEDAKKDREAADIRAAEMLSAAEKAREEALQVKLAAEDALYDVLEAVRMTKEERALFEKRIDNLCISDLRRKVFSEELAQAEKKAPKKKIRPTPVEKKVVKDSTEAKKDD